jgi:hypothetical protein
MYYFPPISISTIIMRKEGWMTYLFMLVVLATLDVDLDFQAPRCKKSYARKKSKLPSSTIYS